MVHRIRPSVISPALLLGAVLLPLHPAERLAAQVISLRSVPVASGDQFLLHPSLRLGMGGVVIALDDAWMDPFVNPAKGGRLDGSSFFGSPTFYGISSDGGGGRTLDLAGLFTGAAWFGGGAVALQQIDNDPARQPFWSPFAIWPPTDGRLDESAARNVYLHGLVGRRIARSDLTLGLGGSWASLDAVDGVDLLYQGSDGVDQRGERIDLRAGVTGRTDEGSSFEALLVYHRIAMTHDVRLVDWVWQDDPQQGGPVLRVRRERDETRTWGLHTGYVAPPTDGGWRVGGIFTANRKTHPKIPNYEIQNIPRDPGDSWAFNAGVGLAREAGPFDFGVDVVFEPIWSETWSVADTAITLPGGGRIEAGEKEVENDFFFSNVHLRMGVAHHGERWRAQLGIRTSAYDYTLEQLDNVESTHREQDEAWMEWSPTWGIGIVFDELELSYSGQLSAGTGRPGVDFVGPRAETFAAAGDFIIAPSGPLTLQEAHVLTHQVVLRLPIH